MARAETIEDGKVLMLKPDRAEAYGLPVGTRLTVSSTFTHPGRAKLWVRVAEFQSPFNVFMASDFK